MSRIAILLLISVLMICSAIADHRVYGIRGKAVNKAAKPKITKEMVAVARVREGFEANDKKRVVRFIIPPRLGGSGDFNNLTTLTRGESEQRKRIEKEVIKKFEKGEITLGDAQSRVVHWKEYMTIQRQRRQMVRISR